MTRLRNVTKSSKLSVGPSFEGLSDELLEHIYTGGLPNVGEWLTSPSLTSTPAAWEASRVGQGARVRVGVVLGRVDSKA